MSIYSYMDVRGL